METKREFEFDPIVDFIFELSSVIDLGIKRKMGRDVLNPLIAKLQEQVTIIYNSGIQPDFLHIVCNLPLREFGGALIVDVE